MRCEQLSGSFTGLRRKRSLSHQRRAPEELEGAGVREGRMLFRGAQHRYKGKNIFRKKANDKVWSSLEGHERGRRGKGGEEERERNRRGRRLQEREEKESLKRSRGGSRGCRREVKRDKAREERERLRRDRGMLAHGTRQGSGERKKRRQRTPSDAQLVRQSV